MMSVPKMTYVLPVRNHLTFTQNGLPSFLMHATREHEVILVVDSCPITHEIRRRPECYPNPQDHASSIASDERDRVRVRQWIDVHAKLLDEHHVRVIESLGDENCWTGGLRETYALNLAHRSATCEWLLCFGDEDLVFMPRWDEALWEAMDGQDPQRAVGLPVMVMPHVEESYPEPLTAQWIHAQRGRCCHQLSYPVRVAHSELGTGRIQLPDFQRFAELASLPGIHEEPCGWRAKCHWVPLLMHRDVFDRVGGYPTNDEAAISFDIHWDDRLGAMGIVKRMPEYQHILHAKHLVYISDEIDRVWGDTEHLSRFRMDRV